MRTFLLSAVAIGAMASAALAGTEGGPADAAPTGVEQPAAALELTDRQMDQVTAGGSRKLGDGFSDIASRQIRALGSKRDVEDFSG
jgi:hypothetical protein